MKKKIIKSILMSITALTLLCGCNKETKVVVVEVPTSEESEKEVKSEEPKEATEEAKEEEKIPVKLGAYVYEYEDEIENTKVKCHSYLYFKEDKSGIAVANGEGLFDYDDDKINYKDGGSNTYKVNADGTLTLDKDGITEEYKYLAETLPEDVVDSLPFDLDGNDKISNMEAADEFNYIITSDSIDFYDYNGELCYAAENSDKKDMKAAYYELTDNKYPVLLITTPHASHAVGYSHALQYLDGTVYNSASLDDIIALYEKSGILIYTHMGGGYGESNYYIFGFDDEGFLDKIAEKHIMEDEEFAASYVANFGEKYQDEYIIYTSVEDSESVTKDEFEKWFSEKTNSEEPVEEINWKTLNKTFYFN